MAKKIPRNFGIFYVWRSKWKQQREQKRNFLLQKRKIWPEPSFLTCHRRPARAKTCQWSLVVVWTNTSYPRGIKVAATRTQFVLVGGIQPLPLERCYLQFPMSVINIAILVLCYLAQVKKILYPSSLYHLTGIWAIHLTRLNVAGFPQPSITFYVWKIHILPFFTGEVLSNHLLSTMLLSLQGKVKNTFSDMKV